MEVDEISSVDSCKSRGKKSKKIPVVPANLSDVGINLEECCFNAEERLRSSIHLLNSSTDQSDERNNILDFVKNIIGTINNAMKTLTCATPIFSNLIQFFIDFLNYTNVELNIRLDAVKTIITLHYRNIFNLESKYFVTVICFLLENCCQNQSDKTMTPFLRDLRKMLVNVRNEDIKSAFLNDKIKISKVFETILNRTQFCCSDVGLDVVACLASLDEEFLKLFHESIKRILISCKRSEAYRFGKTYYRIWNLLEDDRQKSFEENYIQWLMERAFTLDRCKPPVLYLSLNLQSLLRKLHESREKAKFSKVITDLYAPILWKYLNSNNNVHRCNAAEIFMDVYPLESKKNLKEYSIFLRKQHDELLALLDDPCPTVRVIAIRGACSNMQYFWVTFQNGTAEKIIEKFVTDLVTDGSSSDVRKAVYAGLTQLLSCKESHALLKGVLPSLGGFIHDVNPSVRQAFISMLQKIKDLRCEIKYWHICDIHNVAVRLADDSPKNQLLIVNLILSSFFNDKIALEDSFRRLCRFINVNPNAIRYLAMYSSNELKFTNAVNVMCFIMKIMFENVAKKMKSLDEDNQELQDSTQSCKSKTPKKVSPNVGDRVSDEDKENVNSTNTNDSSVVSNASELNRSTNLLDPYISHGLMDFVAMLWLIHGKMLEKEENRELQEKVHNAAAKFVPAALRFFKETHAFYGALNLASLMPLSKIGHLATVVSGSVSILRRMSPDSSDSEIHCLVYALCTWKRGDEVIGLAKEWLDETFRSEALNESYALEDRRRERRVRFLRSEAQPAFALRILNELFASPSNQRRIFSSDVSDLRSLMTFLSRIKILIDRRIDKESELSSLLSDEILVNTLMLYGNLIILFNENKVDNFNFWKKFSNYLDWCSSIVTRCCSVEMDYDEMLENYFVCEVLHVPLKQCLNLIAIGKCDEKQLISILKFCKSTLDSECGLKFVEISVEVLKQLILFSRVHQVENRNNEAMAFWFPCIVDKLLTLLTEKIYSKNVLSSCIKRIGNLKKNIVYIYILTGKLYPELSHSSPSYKIMQSFCHALINIVLFPITECETLNVDENMKNLPYIGSFLASIFMAQFDLGSALLFVLNNIIEQFTEKDGLFLLAVTSLLYTFAFSDCKIPKSEVLKSVKKTYQKLQNLPAEEGHVALVMNREQTMADRTIIDVEEATESAVKELGQHILKKIADRLGGSLS